MSRAVKLWSSKFITDDYEKNWRDKNIEQIMWGLDTVGCLGFLHGMKGETSHKIEYLPDWLLGLGWNEWRRDMGTDPWLTLRTSPVFDWEHGTCWWNEWTQPPLPMPDYYHYACGNMESAYHYWREQYDNSLKTRKMRLGKWLRKVGATPEQIKEFETRKLAHWSWSISADPADVLTIAGKRRGWSSCMSPGGDYASGLFSDLRAGSAVMFWHRPGDDKPSGREILRPAAIAGKPVIIRPGKIYGCGIRLSTRELSKLLGVTVRRMPLKKLVTRSIHDGIYCDVGRDVIEQTEEQRKRAEERLRAAWREYIPAGKIYNMLPPGVRILRHSSREPERIAA